MCPELPLEVDASYLLKGAFTSNRGAFTGGRNGDLWSGIYAQIDDRHSFPLLRKVKSHRQPTHCRPGQDLQDWLGSALADKAADESADRWQLPDLWHGLLSDRLSIGFVIAVRLGVVEAAAREASPRLVPAPILEPVPSATSRRDAIVELEEAV